LFSGFKCFQILQVNISASAVSDKILYTIQRNFARDFFDSSGKRKGDGIPLLVYGRNGKKEVEDWWKRWRLKIEGRGESFSLLR
jgi:hypothetical protein